MTQAQSQADKAATATSHDSIQQGLTRFCQRHFSDPVDGLKRLTAGANMEIWAFDCGPQKLILRRHPGGIAPDKQAGGMSLDDEASIVDLAFEHGVRAPQVIGRLLDEDGLGTGFVMARAEGEALPYKLFKDPSYQPALAVFTQHCAEQLAKIHAMPVDRLAEANVALRATKAAESVANLKTLLDTMGAKSPVFALALNWLENNLPAEAPQQFLHGDFRMGNLLIDATGISAVLDWELAHIGDPAEDLAWLCMPSWRFGNYHQPVGGVGQIEDFLTAYEAASGRQIDRARFHFWLIYASLNWGAMTLRMTQIWRTGLDRSVERALIGTRSSEVEIDLLMMLEQQAGISAPLDTDLSLPETERRSAEPEAGELLTAMTAWIKDDLIPRQTGSDLFNARVAGNTLSIVQRMSDYGPHFSKAQAARLAALDLTHDGLCDALYAGEIDLAAPSLLTHLRLQALERLTIHQPRYAGLKVAQEKWGVTSA